MIKVNTNRGILSTWIPLVLLKQVRILHANRHAGYAILISLLVLTGFGCRNKGGGQNPQGGPAGAQSYPVFKTTPHNTTLQTEYPATLQGQQNIEIRPKIDGYIEQIYIDEGAR